MGEVLRIVVYVVLILGMVVFLAYRAARRYLYPKVTQPFVPGGIAFMGMVGLGLALWAREWGAVAIFAVIFVYYLNLALRETPAD
jgi:predicted permease